MADGGLEQRVFVEDSELDNVPLDGDEGSRPGGIGGEVIVGQPFQTNGFGRSTSSTLDDSVVPRTIHVPPGRAAPLPGSPRRRLAAAASDRLSSVPSGDRLLLAMTIVAVVVAFVALLLGGLGLSARSDIIVNVTSGTYQPSSQEGNTVDDKMWLFALGDQGSSLEYTDIETGEVKGYNVDVIRAVCRIAGKNCQLVYDVNDRCWETVVGGAERGGLGLFGGFYDGCTGWSRTHSRDRTFKFTDAMGKEQLSFFMISATAELSSFNWRDLTGKTIGFLQSYLSDENCLKRFPEITGSDLSKDRVRYFATQEDLLDAVNDGEVDAVFVNEYVEVARHMQVASEKLSKCSLSGPAVMTRKDSGLDRWWNPAFRSLTTSAEYRQICEALEDPNIHGSMAGPSISQQCIGF